MNVFCGDVCWSGIVGKNLFYLSKLFGWFVFGGGNIF